MKTISKTKAVELIEKFKGTLFSTTFITSRGEERTINGQFVKTTSLGYIHVKEMSKVKSGERSFKTINPRTMKYLAIKGQKYSVK